MRRLHRSATELALRPQQLIRAHRSYPPALPAIEYSSTPEFLKQAVVTNPLFPYAARGGGIGAHCVGDDAAMVLQCKPSVNSMLRAKCMSSVASQARVAWTMMYAAGSVKSNANDSLYLRNQKCGVTAESYCGGTASEPLCRTWQVVSRIWPQCSRLH